MSLIGANEGLVFLLVSQVKKIDFDYTPNYYRPTSGYTDAVTFPKVLANKAYKYQVVVDGVSKGIRRDHSVAPDGSQKINFLDYNAGYGIPNKSSTQVYAVDPDTGIAYYILTVS
ncbi:immunomodulatory protein FIP-Fve [Amanita muscaria]